MGVHHAAENGRLEVLEVLDDFGADFSATTIKGETAIHLAARKGNTTLENFELIEKYQVSRKYYKPT